MLENVFKIFFKMFFLMFLIGVNLFFNDNILMFLEKEEKVKEVSDNKEKIKEISNSV